MALTLRSFFSRQTVTYLVMGVVLVALGLLVAVLLGRQHVMSCQSSGWCLVTSSHLFGESRAEGLIGGARTEVHRSAGGLIATTALVVTLSGEEVEINLIAADGNELDRLVAALNAITRGDVVSPQRFVEDTRLLGWGFGLFLAALGVLVPWSLLTGRATPRRRFG